MSDKLGMRTFGNKQEMVFLGREISEQKDYSERTALEIDREIDALIGEGRTCASEMLTKNKSKLKALATMLINQETLEGGALEKLLSRKSASPRPKPKVKKTDIPAPVAPVGEGEKVVKPQKAPGVPQLVPKQTPAPSD